MQHWAEMGLLLSGKVTKSQIFFCLKMALQIVITGHANLHRTCSGLQDEK